MLKEIGGPEKRERDQEELVSGTVRTHNFYQLSSLSYRAHSMVSSNGYNRNINDHLPQITIANIIIMKKFGILRELPVCDRETQYEQVLLKIYVSRLAWYRVATNLHILKNTGSAKCKVKHKKMRSSCATKLWCLWTTVTDFLILKLRSLPVFPWVFTAKGAAHGW